MDQVQKAVDAPVKSGNSQPPPANLEKSIFPEWENMTFQEIWDSLKT